MDDYNILHRKFEVDTEQQRFRRAPHDGFHVKDPSVLNEALMELAESIRKLTRPLEKERLVIIDFAPSDYRAALKLFRHEIQDNAYFLMLYTDLDTCIQRKSGVYEPHQNNHFVSEETMRTYYFHNDLPNIKIHLQTDYNVTDERIKIINNTDPSMSFFIEITWLAETIFNQQRDLTKETEKLHNIPVLASIHEPDQEAFVSQETEPIPVVTPIDESIEL